MSDFVSYISPIWINVLHFFKDKEKREIIENQSNIKNFIQIIIFINRYIVG